MALGEQHVAALDAVDGLGDVEVAGERAQHVGFVGGEGGAAADVGDGLADGLAGGLVEVLVEADADQVGRGLGERVSVVEVLASESISIAIALQAAVAQNALQRAFPLQVSWHGQPASRDRAEPDLVIAFRRSYELDAVLAKQRDQLSIRHRGHDGAAATRATGRRRRTWGEPSRVVCLLLSTGPKPARVRDRSLPPGCRSRRSIPAGRRSWRAILPPAIAGPPP